ncbi:aminopeptidase P family protein [Paraferrimonas sp. SM1919]|uniref:aminopeptidase P family protein n=1 Tax=Paraferrimonas sp. SM1919 TaxID=2662263 RepID=UPI0013D8C12A|nr:aminopeptidase P family protein [Paraferrimonas sp. SM1919]
MSPQQKLEALRTQMRAQNVQALFIPRADEYMGEYVLHHNERLRFATGFTGSAGMAIITLDSAAIFVDGRYTVQVRQQLSADLFEFYDLDNQQQLMFLAKSLKQGDKVAIDANCHSLTWVNNTNASLQILGIELAALPNNLIDAIWQDRPQPSQLPTFTFSNESAGATSIEKRQLIAAEINKHDADALLITELDAISWLLNLRSLNIPCLPVVIGRALLYANGDMVFATNTALLEDDVSAHVGSGVRFIEEADFNKEFAALNGKTMLADANISHAASQLAALDAGIELINATDPTALIKAQKNPTELAGMRQAHIKDGIAVTHFLAWLDEEVAAGNFYDEGVLADKLKRFREVQPGFKDLSFDTISAVGGNAAMCHYNHKDTTPAVMPDNSIYLVDSGGQYLEGTTDVTRTIAIGQPSSEHIKMVTLVLKGHIALDQQKFPRGTCGAQLDVLARQHLWNQGFDYDHGTGHGVGHMLSVHEGPQRIAKNTNSVPLLPGMVVSNEPGYYKADDFGIRIENLIAVREMDNDFERPMLGFEALTLIPIDKRLIDKTLLNENEINWLNSYHLQVQQTLMPQIMDKNVQLWLAQATSEL